MVAAGARAEISCMKKGAHPVESPLRLGISIPPYTGADHAWASLRNIHRYDNIGIAAYPKKLQFGQYVARLCITLTLPL
uniref:Uncharacterized protein n=1 Tax=Leersia perrieri TaxID=77586 RepID=A0A0D9XQT4_9ORYZ